jgi:hypothetical protein
MSLSLAHIGRPCPTHKLTTLQHTKPFNTSRASQEYSLDGAKTFNSSLAPISVGQCIRSIGTGQGFAAVGTFGLLSESNGVAVSYDAGISFKAINISVLTAETRYGAFPTTESWYVSAGDWPGEGSDDGPPCDDPPCQKAAVPSNKVYEKLVDPANYYPVPPKGTRLVSKKSSRIHLLREPSGKTKYAVVAKGRLHSSNHPSRKLQPVDTWEAQIATTKDAGKTWDLSFSRIGQFYFNGIECSHEDSCCVVAEAQDNTTSAGTYVWCTTDGGKTWVDNFWDKDQKSSLLDIAAVGPNEFWAVGGELGEVTVQYPTFYHTTDGGQSWTKAGNLPADMLFQYAIAVDCAGGNCWALLLDILTQESSLASLKK